MARQMGWWCRRLREAHSLPRSGFRLARSAFPGAKRLSVVAQRATSRESRGDELFPPLIASVAIHFPFADPNNVQIGHLMAGFLTRKELD
jgi:hypothetical protein